MVQLHSRHGSIRCAYALIVIFSTQYAYALTIVDDNPGVCVSVCLLSAVQSSVVVVILIVCQVSVSIAIYANQSQSQAEKDLSSGWNAASSTTLLALQNSLQCCGLKVHIRNTL
jgi:hypothetical protein